MPPDYNPWIVAGIIGALWFLVGLPVSVAFGRMARFGRGEDDDA